MKSAFDRIAGYKEEKKELLDVCNAIKKKEQLKEAGGKMPKGILLYGPVGVGKTVLAKAFMRESECYCIDVKISDFNGDSGFSIYLDKVFREAKLKKPCIIFIDEIDKLVGRRESFMFEDDNIRSTILLNAINKYVDEEDIILFFIANDEQRLDEALIRSGRIDKKIKISYPNEEERADIFNYYGRNKKFDKSVNFKSLAKITEGFTGADIEALLNDAVVKAVSSNRDYITSEDILNSHTDKVFNCKGKLSALDPINQKMLAYHEAGHATISLLNNKDTVFCASIVSRGISRGYVAEEPNDNKLTTLDDLKDKVKVCLGGMAAEEVFLNKRTIGNYSDIVKAKEIVRRLVRDFGVNGLDTICLNDNSSPYGSDDNNRSDYRLRKIEENEDKIITELYEATKDALRKNKKLFKDIANALIDKKVLNKDEISEIYKKYKADKKKHYRVPRHQQTNKGVNINANV